MKTILVINDNTPAATHAAEFASMLAQQCNADIVLANTVVSKYNIANKLSLSNNGYEIVEAEFSATGHHLSAINIPITNFLPGITEIDISNTDERALAELINRNKIWMMVKGTPAVITETNVDPKPGVHIVLNKITCPLLLIPEHWPIKIIERVTYISDLRYCRIEIIRYLAKLARRCHADLSFAHLTAKGLPDMGDEYALNMFTDVICRNVQYDQLFFNKIKKRDFATAIDVMINGMQNDILAFVNHHLHIEEILGGYENKLCQAPITAPMLIFPY